MWENCTFAAFSDRGASNLVLPIAEAAVVEPELPRVYIDTKYTQPSKTPKFVAAGDDLQAVLNAAQPGDVITLQAGATFTGNFILPAKSGSDWITIRSSAPDSSLPKPGVRITPSFSSAMPKLVTPNDQIVLTAADSAHHYRIIGVEFTASAAVEQVETLIRLGDFNADTLDKLPHDIILDRVYVHGNPTRDLRRGVEVNSGTTAVIDSYISDIHFIGFEAQAIGVFNSPGPLKFVNNYLEGAGENVLIGGSDPRVVNMVPSDIEFRRNYCFKPTSWRLESPDYAGKPWTVKNIFELKNAQRVIVDGNVFENTWAQAQVGFAILFTVRNQDGSAPWSTVEDVTFTNNVIRHAGSGIEMHGSDNNQPSKFGARFRISNNLFDDIDGQKWGGSGWFMLVDKGPNDVVVEHNTVFQSNHIMVAGTGPTQNFIFRNNIVPHNEYGIFGDGTGTGNIAISTYFPGGVFEKNVMIGADSKLYPAGNFFPANFDGVGFVNRASGNYRLSTSSPYKKAGTDGKDIGVDFDALNAAVTGTTSVTIVSSANYLGDKLALESIVSAFGAGLATTIQSATFSPLPTVIEGTSVTVKDGFGVVWPCPLFFVSPTQINYQIPQVSALGPAEVTVYYGDVAVSNTTIQVSRVSPGIFTADSSGTGLPAGVVLRVKPNKIQIFEPLASYDATQKKYVAIPIDVSSLSDEIYLVLFGTGIRYRTALSAVVAKVGGVDSQVTYAGDQGSLVGLDQVNIRLGRNLIGKGDTDVVLMVNDEPSNVINVNIK